MAIMDDIMKNNIYMSDMFRKLSRIALNLTNHDV